MLASVIALAKSFVEAYTAHVRNYAIQTRNNLRNEEKQLRADILAAASAGNIKLQNELEDSLADAKRDSALIQPPA
jgi:hypothetical protein